MHIVAVLNQKGGVGKSTLSTNLAAAAHLAGRRTLVLDLDEQGSAMDWFHARQPDSQLDGLGVARADRALSAPKFRALASGYEAVFCDGPPRLGEITRAAAVVADVVLIPLRAGGFDYWACPETLATLDEADAIREQLGKRPVRRLVVINGALAGSRVARFAFEALSDTEGLTVASVVVHNRVAFAEAAVSGESVLTVAPESAAAAEVRSLSALVTPKGRVH